MDRIVYRLVFQPFSVETAIHAGQAEKAQLQASQTSEEGGRGMDNAWERSAKAATPDLAALMEAVIKGRFSCRAFRPEPVPRAMIERILAMAQCSASWCNSQAWQLHITEGAATERFRQALLAQVAANPEGDSDIERPREYRGVYLERRRECGFQLYNALGIARGDREGYARQGLENFRLFGAPHVAIVTSDEALGPYGAVDCGAYVATFMVAAQSCGVATIAQAALARQASFLHRFFGIGADRLVVCGISFGFADEAHQANSFRTRRALIDDAVDFVSE
jgi:nitroreductase